MAEEAHELAKIANVLALMATKDLNKGERANALAICGFSNKEIAALTDSTEGSIRSMISAERRKRSGAGG